MGGSARPFVGTHSLWPDQPTVGQIIRRAGTLEVHWDPYVITKALHDPLSWRLFTFFDWRVPDNVYYANGIVTFRHVYAAFATYMRFLGPPPPHRLSNGGLLAAAQWYLPSS